MAAALHTTGSSVKKVLTLVNEAAKSKMTIPGLYLIGGPPRVVAVSKRQPVEKIQAVYEEGIRHFGENYIQELSQKAHYLQALGCYPDIKWHFIGNLQSNKTLALARVPNLWMIESVSSIKMAEGLNRAWELRGGGTPLKVLVQVNTAEEPTKYGCKKSLCTSVASYIKKNCQHLELLGLMALGKTPMGIIEEDDKALVADFATISDCLNDITRKLKPGAPLELSMGMSHNFEQAVHYGSTNVRIGTALFGQRSQ